MKLENKVLESVDNSILCAGIDIGSSRVTCVIGKVDYEKRRVEVCGSAIVNCEQGIEAGAVINISEAAFAIRAAVSEAQKNAGGVAQKVIVSVRGKFIEPRTEIAVTGTDVETKKVTQNTIDTAIDIAQGKAIEHMPTSYMILQTVQKQMFFDKIESKASIGMKGTSLSVEIYVLGASIFDIDNIETALNDAGFSSENNRVYSYLAASDVLIKNEEKESGCLVVDFGGATIGLVLYVDRKLEFTYELGIGGDLLTRDLSIDLKTPRDEARKIKEKHGAAVIGEDFENCEIDYVAPDGVTYKKEDTRHIIEDVLQPEMDRILASIEEVLAKHQYDNDNYRGGIILTGGASRMKNIKEAFERFFEDSYVRVARPLEEKVIGRYEIINDASYTAAIGALYFDVSNPAPVMIKKRSAGTGFLAKLIKVLKEQFQ
jgi:cell division protein FtsA